MSQSNMDTESMEDWADQANAQVDEAKRIADHRNNLIHRVFVQSEPGRELFKILTDHVLYQPSVTPEATQFGADIAEGRKSLIREFMLSIKQVENEQ